MKSYLKKSNYESTYQMLVSRYSLIIKPKSWADILNENELSAIILNDELLISIYTNQSLAKFAKWCFDRYYNVMRYLFCIGDKSYKHSDI